MDKQFSSLDRLSSLENISSMDDFDLAVLGLGLPQEEEKEEDAPTINPLHDMDSLDFHLWMEEEVDKERMRRLAQSKVGQTDKK